MFDIKATQAWWNFFHRFCQIYRQDKFDHIVLLGINLLQCEACRADAKPFYISIGRGFSRDIGVHKTPFEKIHILHNYVNRKLDKKVYNLEENLSYSSDIWEDNTKKIINWTKMTQYFFDLIFAMSTYIQPNQYNDFKEFILYVYDSFNLDKTRDGNMVNFTNAKSVEDFQYETYKFYEKAVNSIKNIKLPTPQSFKEIYNREIPKKCASCEKKKERLAARRQALKEQELTRKPMNANSRENDQQQPETIVKIMTTKPNKETSIINVPQGTTINITNKNGITTESTRITVSE